MPEYHVVSIVGDDGGREMEVASKKIAVLMEMRRSWVARCQSATRLGSSTEWKVRDGYCIALNNSHLDINIYQQLRRDILQLRETSHDGACRSASRNRLDILYRKYSMFANLNKEHERQSVAKSKQDNPGKIPYCQHKLISQLELKSAPSDFVDLHEIIHIKVKDSFFISKNDMDIITSPQHSKKPLSLCIKASSTMSVGEHMLSLFMPFWLSDKTYGSIINRIEEVIYEPIESYANSELPELPYSHPVNDIASSVPDIVLLYSIWCNVSSINELRNRSGHQKPLSLSVRTTNRDHLIGGFLLCSKIQNSIILSKVTVMQYVYYLSGIYITASPIKESKAEREVLGTYANHPIKILLSIGLRVVLEAEPHRKVSSSSYVAPSLDFEIAVASNVLHLTEMDMCETAVHSFRIVDDSSSAVNFIRKRLPKARQLFRQSTLQSEHELLRTSCQRFVARSLSNAAESSYEKRHRETEAYIQLGRLDINGPVEIPTSQLSSAAEQLRTLLMIRKRRTEFQVSLKDRTIPIVKEQYTNDPLPEVDPVLALQLFKKTGVFGCDNVAQPEQEIQKYHTFCKDYEQVCKTISRPEVIEFCRRRLLMLGNKYDIHTSLRRLEETGFDAVGRAVKVQDHRDFYQCVKVDTHVHMAAGMTASDLLQFIREKLELQGDDVISVQSDKNGHKRVVTLSDLMKKMNVTSEDLSVASLGVQADSSVFERFDNFNSKYSPLGKADLRTIFLKTDSKQNEFSTDVLEGRYFAELIKRTFKQMAKNHYSESRISIYGRSIDEWEKLAAWHSTNGMGSHKNTWLIQIPRLYFILRKNKSVNCFADVLHNIFSPLWDASANPGKHPQLDHFLRHTSGFDCVDSEDVIDAPLDSRTPHEWCELENPPYAYWMFYISENIKALNIYRASKGQSLLSFRPHSGECGDPKHLAASYLTACGISHGIQLRLSPPLQYLYYLTQIPIALSPLSNNSLFLDLEQSPFLDFFKRGLNVSLSTDDPLFFHHTQEPLVEEYSVAGKLWRLSSTDLCEIARNSTRQSGFPPSIKRNWGGDYYMFDSSLCNNVLKTHVPDIRVAYRFEVYHDEMLFLDRIRTHSGESLPPPVPKFMRTLEEEDSILSLIGTTREDVIHKQSKL